MKNEDGFEWLTEEICNEYIERAKKLSQNAGNDTGSWRALRIELQERCRLTEVQAVNILRDKKSNIRDYLNYYGILSGEIPEPPKMREKREKDLKKKSVADKMREYGDRIADLESLAKNNISSFGFEERD